MDDPNGVLKGHTKAVSGVNGALKSSLKSSLNGHAVVPKNTPTSSRPGLFGRSFNMAARLLTWYSILTILFRCPATFDACNESSPRICRPYFQLKQTVSPHVETYYDTYAAPYVDLVRPYYNTVDQAVLAPGWGYAKRYGAPRVEQAQVFGRTQWEKTVQPQIVKYQHLSRVKYDETLAPHVERLTSAVAPYYDIARTNALQTYHELLLPSYRYVEPYAKKTYHVTSSFTTGTAAPTVIWFCNKTYVFLEGSVWPQLRIIYVENVEPQLVKIGQRLGRHSNGKKTVSKPLADVSTSPSTKATSSFIKPSVSIASTVAVSAQSSTTSATQDLSHTHEVESSTESLRPRSSVEPAAAPPTEGEPESRDSVVAEARKAVVEDLGKWQERYTKAADEAATEIQERVHDITKRMIRRNARITGKSLLEQLKSSVVSELFTLRVDILQVVTAVTKGEVASETGQQDIVAAVRRAGMAIKEKAQEIRSWRESYEAEMQGAITTAAQTHFTILDQIRDLALQKIGMKWAWMDGVTYKDWAKYHELKNRLDEWKGDLESLVVSHKGIQEAQLEAAHIEDEAMDTAASAAGELARLKQVAIWKLIAADDTPEFDSTLMQQAAEAAAAAKEVAASAVHKVEDVAENVKDTVVDKVGQATELVHEGLSSAASLVSPEDASETTFQTGHQGANEEHPVVSEAVEAVESATSIAQGTISSLADEASESLGIVSQQLSSVIEPVSEATSSPEDDVVQEASVSPTEGTPDLASTVILEQTPVFVGNTTELEEDGPVPVELPVEEIEEQDIIVSTGEATPSVYVKPAFLGAAAQSVPRRQPILDDDEDDSTNALDSIREDLKSVYSAALSQANEQYSQALSVVSVQIHGTPKPAHEQMLASVTSAYSHAMESANSRLDNALRAASQLYSGSPTTKHILPTTVPLPSVPTAEWAHIESIAAQRLQEGRAWAGEQYESAKIAIGLATPTPSTPSEHVNKMLENARYNYYAGLGVAHDRYSEFMAAATAALSSWTATPTPTDLAGTASSLASVASESAAAAALAVGENMSSAAAAGYDHAAAAAESAASAASSVGENVSSVAAAGYDNAAAAAESAASVASSAAAAGYDNAAAAAESAASVASSAAAAGYDNASAVAESAASVASSAAAAGYDNASAVAESAASVASSAAAAGYDNAASAAEKVSENWDVVVSRISIQIYGAPTPTPWYESAYNLAGGYAASAAGVASDGAASVSSAANTYAAAATAEVALQYSAVSSILSEALVGKEPTFSESVISRLSAAYETGISSASSLASAAQATAAAAVDDAGEAAKNAGEKVASVASEATEAVKEKVDHIRDEL